MNMLIGQWFLTTVGAKVAVYMVIVLVSRRTSTI